MTNLDTLLALLGEVGSRPSADEVAEALWLALLRHQPAASEAPEGSVQGASSGPEQGEASQPPDPGPEDEATPEEAPPRPATRHMQHAAPLVAQAAGTPTHAGTTGSPINIPAPPPLPDGLALARALRPLRRRIPSQVRFSLDEVATSQRSAEERSLTPVLRPALAPWLSLDLVVDESDSMLIWRPAAVALAHLLGRLGAFRRVRLWSFDPFAPQRPPILTAGLRRPRGTSAPHHLKELVDPSGNHLIVVFSDCVAPGWHSGAVAQAIAGWARTNPVALIQALPSWLWSRTALDRAAGIEVRGRTPAVANTHLEVRLKDDWIDDSADLPSGIPVPVLPLEAHALRRWAQMLLGGLEFWSPGLWLPTELQAPPDAVAADVAPEERVHSFYANASPSAQRLAERLAVAPLTLPVVRLVQHATERAPSQAHIAEVIFSGLAYREALPRGGDARGEILFEFYPGVREELFKRLKLSEATPVLELVTEHIEHARRVRTMGAGLAGLDGQTSPVPVIEELPFARARVALLRSLGYERQARQLEQQKVRPLTAALMGQGEQLEVGPQPQPATGEPPTSPPPEASRADGAKAVLGDQPQVEPAPESPPIAELTWPRAWAASPVLHAIRHHRSPADIAAALAALAPAECRARVAAILTPRDALPPNGAINDAPESPAFADVARVLLDCLLEAEMRDLAFVAWLALADVAPALRGEVRYCGGMAGYVEACLAESADPPAFLAHLLASDVLLAASETDRELDVAMRAVALRCLVECGSPQAAGLLQSPGSWSRTAPQLSRLMLALARQAPPGADTPMITAALQLREKVDALALELKREPEYHGVSAAQRVWRALKSEQLEPLSRALRQPGEHQAPRSQELRAIDVDGLIQRHPENARAPLEHHVYDQIKHDLEEVLGFAADALELLETWPALAHLVSGYEQQQPAIDNELRRVADFGPLAEWAVERMIRPVLQLKPLVSNPSHIEVGPRHVRPVYYSSDKTLELTCYVYVKNVGKRHLEDIELRLSFPKHSDQLSLSRPVQRIPSLRQGDQRWVEWNLTLNELPESEERELELVVQVAVLDPKSGANLYTQSVPLTRQLVRFDGVNVAYPAGALRPENVEQLWGREQLLRDMAGVITSGGQSPIFFLEGVRKVGKTSIMYFLADKLADDTAYVYVNFDTGWTNIYARIGQAFQEQLFVQRQRAQLAELPPVSSAPELSALVSAVLVRTGMRLLLLFDEFGTATGRLAAQPGGANFLGDMREILGRFAGRIAVVMTDPRLLRELKEQLPGQMWADVNRRQVSFLDTASTTRAVRGPARADDRITFSEEVVRRIYHYTGGYPWHIQLLCFGLMRHLDERRRYEVFLQDVGQQVEELLEQDNYFEEGLARPGRLSRADREVLAALARRATTEPAALDDDPEAQWLAVEQVILDLPQTSQLSEEEVRARIRHLGEIGVLISERGEERQRVRFSSLLLARWFQKAVRAGRFP